MSSFNLLRLGLFCILLSSNFTTSAQTYMDIITDKSCDCLTTVPDKIKTDELQLRLGICMLEAAEPYKKQLKKDYDIELDKNDDSGEKLGRIIGLKMATKCPSALMKMAGQVDEPPTEDKTISGVITKMETDPFVIFSLKDDQGKISKFYWFTFIESAIEMSTNYKSIVGKPVKITYSSQDFFDPKLDEYRPVSIILKLELQ